MSGYDVELGHDLGVGYVVGVAYELPEYAARVAVTYNSRITHDFDTTETFTVDTNADRMPDGTTRVEDGTTTVDTPQSVNIDLQTGIAEGTLLFGRIRWADWSEFEIAPEVFEDATGSGLVTVDDSVTYTLGVGRQVTDRFAASAAVLYDDVQGDDLVSPLAPTQGYTGLRLGASYRIDNVEIAGGVLYRWLGDANPETGTPDTQRARFDDNTAYSVALGVGIEF